MRLLPLLALLPTLLPAYECLPPALLCQQLTPNMILFIGKPVSRQLEPYRAVTVTFEVQELFWGPAGQRSFRLLFSGFDGYGNPSATPEFFAAFPLPDGRYQVGQCLGLHLPVSHPFVIDYRRIAAERTPIALRVRAESNRAPVADTEFQLSGTGLPFRGRMSGDAPYRIPALRPGTYKLSAKRANFTQVQPSHDLSIPPGTCADLVIPMTSLSSVSGTALDARGTPLRNARLHLMGEGRSLANPLANLDTLRDNLLRFLGWTNPWQASRRLLSNHTRTDRHPKEAPFATSSSASRSHPSKTHSPKLQIFI